MVRDAASLKLEPQPQLHLSRRIGERRDAPEVLAREARLRCSPDLAVEQVEDLEPELESRRDEASLLLLADLTVTARPARRIAAHRPERAILGPNCPDVKEMSRET